MDGKNKANAEDVFRKSRDEMSSMEKMMADIIDEQSPEAEAPGEITDTPSAGRVEPPKRTRRATTMAEENAKYTLTPETRMGDIDPSLKKDTSRSRNRKKKKMLPVIAILCGIIAIGALILSSAIRNLSYERIDNADNFGSSVSASGAKPTPDDGLVIPTPEPGDGEITEPIVVIPEEKKKEHAERYEFRVADVSWTKAKELAEAEGGHLVTVSSQEEYDEIVTLAMMNDCSYVWLGCHRENGALVWENGEEISFYRWGDGEPSQYDSGDKVSEDYVLLWKFRGAWVYNDSRDDPCADYPDMYSGKIGYVIEYED